MFLPIEEYNAFVKTWEAKERRSKYRIASVVAAIINKPVYGREPCDPVTPEEVLGEVNSDDNLPSLEDYLNRTTKSDA